MARIKFTTTLDENLLALAKERSSHGANEIIEKKALRLYFRNMGVTVWEKKALIQKITTETSCSKSLYYGQIDWF